MSWASVYWDLEYIVKSARDAMEAAFAADTANAAPGPDAVHVSPPLEDPLTHADTSATAAFDAPLPEPEIAIPAAVKSDVEVTDQPKEKAPENLQISLTKTALASKPLVVENIPAPIRSLWTPEIEAALREFLRPLSVELRYEYRYSDVLDEKRSIATMNSLFRNRPRTDDTNLRESSSRNEIARKRNQDVRRLVTNLLNTKKPQSDR